MDNKSKIKVESCTLSGDNSFQQSHTLNNLNHIPASKNQRKRKSSVRAVQSKKRKSDHNAKALGKPRVVKKRQPTSKAGTKRQNIKQNVSQGSSKDSNGEKFTFDINIPTAIKDESSIVDNPCPSKLWKDEDLVAEIASVPSNIARNVMKLLDQDCTVPFIARYRKEACGTFGAEKVRDIQTAYENIKALHKKVETIVKTLVKDECDQKVIFDLQSAKTLEEVEYLYAPYKPGSKRSLAERAKKLGLEPIAQDVLNGKINLNQIPYKELIDEKIPGKTNETEVLKGIQNIIADIVAKDRDILDFMRNNQLHQIIQVSSRESNNAKKEQKKAFVEGKETQNYKFENYFNFFAPVRNIGAHQVLALNRGENLKILTVKLVIPPAFTNDILRKCRFRFGHFRDKETIDFIDKCIKDAYDRLLEPHISRQIRSELTKKASKESVNVFCSNLKHLLLTPPVRGKIVIGIDPGFKHGCKIAVISCTGEVLKTDVLNLHSSKIPAEVNKKRIVDIVSAYEATLIAIGNGTACRETEMWLSNLIKTNAFHPYNVKYCIIDESGISIYSVTKEAESELPDLDPNLRSAVAIARRLQDPLLEYVKVEPKHLGVGMYQHDVPEAALKNALESVVVECVSFVGVDLNVCAEVLLKKISGLSASRVKSIIEWRNANGPFINRKQLLEVKGLGPKSFEQCAGFIKIFPQTSSESIQDNKFAKTKPNRLDTTIIHPESYDAAEKFLVELKASSNDVGSQEFVDKFERYMKLTSVERVASKLDVDLAKMQLIVEAFKQVMTYDIRAAFKEPLFKTEVQSMCDIKPGQILTGRVANVTHFGAFVDIGVGQAGLIHTSKMMNQTLHLGNKVTVRVLSVDVAKKRISLAVVADL